jgi:hypothetical protein
MRVARASPAVIKFLRRKTRIYFCPVPNPPSMAGQHGSARNKRSGRTFFMLPAGNAEIIPAPRDTATVILSAAKYDRFSWIMEKYIGLNVKRII